MLSLVKNLLYYLFIFIWVIFLLYVLNISARITHDQLKSHIKIAAPPPLSTFSSNLVNILTLGHRGLFDDFLQIWLIQIVADNRLSTKDLSAFLQTVHHIIKHKPQIESIYMLSCFTLAEIFIRPDLCQPISLIGLKAIPKSWRISMMQGWVHAFKTNEPAQAAIFYSIAASRIDIKASKWVRSLVNRLLQEQNLTEEDLTNTLDALFGESDSKMRDLFFKASKSNSLDNKNYNGELMYNNDN